MPQDYGSLPALLPVKLEDAIAAWLRAKRGPLMPGVTIIGAHEPGVPAAPFLSVFCRGTRTHPDFAGVSGSDLPKLASVEFNFRIHKELDFRATVSRWAGECYTLLSHGAANVGAMTPERAEFRGLMADLNAGGPHHPADGLHIYEVADAEDSLGYAASARTGSFELEMTAQARDAQPS